MKYPDEQEVRLGDRVRLGQDGDGVVVASIDAEEYSVELQRRSGVYLKKGVISSFSRCGLIHYEHVEFDLQLIYNKAVSATALPPNAIRIEPFAP